MTTGMADRRLDVDLLVRELGNWRTASASGPVYQGLSDGLRMLIVDGRVPVGSRLPSERALADAAAGVPHHGHRGLCPDARGGLPQRPPGRAQHDGTANEFIVHTGDTRAGTAGTGGHQPRRRHHVGSGVGGARRLRCGRRRHQLISAPGRPRTVRRGTAARRDRRTLLRPWPSHHAGPDHGHHGRARRHRPDPVDIRRAGRPRAGRTAHLLRSAVRDRLPPACARSRWPSRPTRAGISTPCTSPSGNWPPTWPT